MVDNDQVQPSQINLAIQNKEVVQMESMIEADYDKPSKDPPKKYQHAPR